ncbi:MAG: hypothetical protein NTW29_16990 [Bacteroidetes bacterium]|nr:hypothetical protein [Bacteroidota bacterium]
MASEPKITTAISAIASVIAILVYLTGKTSIPDFFSKSKITQPLISRGTDTVKTTSNRYCDSIALKKIISNEISSYPPFVSLQSKVDSLLISDTTIIISDPPPPTEGCDINGKQYGETQYLIFLKKKGNVYDFNGSVSQAVSGKAYLNGKEIELKGGNCSGKLILLNNCTRLEGSMKYYYNKENFHDITISYELSGSVTQ